MSRCIEVMARARDSGEWRWSWGVNENGRVLAWSEPVHRSPGEARQAGERFLGLEASDGNARIVE